MSPLRISVTDSTRLICTKQAFEISINEWYQEQEHSEVADIGQVFDLMPEYE